MEPSFSPLSVKDQFDNNVLHYLGASQMADSELLDLIVQCARPQPEDQVLDVACGAGFLTCALARLVKRAEGIDLSGAMLREAGNHARSLWLSNVGFHQGDSAALPFGEQAFDIVTCKLALHYFPDPDRAIGEMKRVVKRGGRIVLIDRVSSEIRQHQEYHNRIEMLRTPSKNRIYSASEIVSLLEQQGLTLEHIAEYEQYQDVDEWLETTGAPEENQSRARELLFRSLTDDLAGLKLFAVDSRLKLTHRIVIIVAGRA
ncbi:MAG: class I SAM-dependent methyltransferase [Desulfuromonadaceae bacterium]